MTQGKWTSLHSEYSVDKWGFIAKELGSGLVDRKLLRGDFRGKSGFWLKGLDRILAEGRNRLRNLIRY